MVVSAFRAPFVFRRDDRTSALLNAEDLSPGMTDTLRLATRGSDLALRQAGTVRDALSSRRRDVELRRVETRGDQIPDEMIHRLGKTGAFVRALDEEVLGGDADLAVHSLKDVPTEGMDDMVIAGVPSARPPATCSSTPTASASRTSRPAPSSDRIAPTNRTDQGRATGPRRRAAAGQRRHPGREAARARPAGGTRAAVDRVRRGERGDGGRKRR